MVSGDGPRDDPNPMLAVLNSKLPTLSARDILDGLTRPRPVVVSDRRDGGRGIAMLFAEVGVGILSAIHFIRCGRWRRRHIYITNFREYIAQIRVPFCEKKKTVLI